MHIQTYYDTSRVSGLKYTSADMPSHKGDIGRAEVSPEYSRLSAAEDASQRTS